MSPIRMEKFEFALRIVIEFTEACNRRDIAGMLRLMSDDCVYENSIPAPDGTLYSGKEAISQFWEDFYRQPPQAHIEIEELFGLGFRCVMRWRFEWVDTAGKKGYIRGVDIFKFKNNLISEQLSYIKG
jgi:predicted SnoaL-like aldol condensation-catalyzing enzyme